MEFLELHACDNLQSIQITGFRVGPSNRNDQQRVLETVIERIMTCPAAPYLKKVELTIQVDPETRNMLVFFGIATATLFESFDWGSIPEILDKGWLGRGIGCNYDERSDCGGQIRRDKELVLIIQGGPKYGCERVEEVLRRGAFRMFDDRMKLLVLFSS